MMSGQTAIIKEPLPNPPRLRGGCHRRVGFFMNYGCAPGHGMIPLNRNSCILLRRGEGDEVLFSLRDVQLILSQDYQTVTVPNQTDDLARHKQYEPTLCDSNDLSNATYL
jgi:hypothetical protein